MEPEECTARWKSLRDKFVRELKKVKGGKSGDAGPPYRTTIQAYLATLRSYGVPVEHHPAQAVSICSILNRLL